MTVETHEVVNPCLVYVPDVVNMKSSSVPVFHENVNQVIQHFVDVFILLILNMFLFMFFNNVC
jgi:hypothetical protein